ncbi:hypothetical protein VTN02DRAFT_344 [Thermoascus thermophilus]
MDGIGRPSVSSSARSGWTTTSVTRSRGNSASTVVSASSVSEQGDGDGDGDVGALALPPPDYEQLVWAEEEEAPPYEPVMPGVDRDEQDPPLRPDIADIPTIRIDTATPAPSNATAEPAASPVQGEEQAERAEQQEQPEQQEQRQEEAEEQRNPTPGGETVDHTA